jgi:hypothetical protein
LDGWQLLMDLPSRFSTCLLPSFPAHVCSATVPALGKVSRCVGGFPAQLRNSRIRPLPPFFFFYRSAFAINLAGIFVLYSTQARRKYPLAVHMVGAFGVALTFIFLFSARARPVCKHNDDQTTGKVITDGTQGFSNLKLNSTLTLQSTGVFASGCPSFIDQIPDCYSISLNATGMAEDSHSWASDPNARQRVELMTSTPYRSGESWDFT